MPRCHHGGTPTLCPCLGVRKSPGNACQPSASRGGKERCPAAEDRHFTRVKDVERRALAASLCLGEVCVPCTAHGDERGLSLEGCAQAPGKSVSPAGTSSWLRNDTWGSHRPRVSTYLAQTLSVTFELFRPGLFFHFRFCWCISN